ncbi:MAG: hypothetical protein ABSD88_02425 [Candidatus Korobacteraceae bacterium]
MKHNEAAGTALAASTERMATAAEQLHALLEKMGQQMEALNRKVDRIVAAIDEAAGSTTASAAIALAGTEAPGCAANADAAPVVAEPGKAGTEATPGTPTSAESAPVGTDTQAKRVQELEKQNAELKAAAEHARRKTLSGATLALLAKSGADDGQAIEGGALEQALRSLSVEQRIAVKAEMARAGLL